MWEGHKRETSPELRYPNCRGSALVKVPAIALLGRFRVSLFSLALRVAREWCWDLGAVLPLRGALAAGLRLAFILRIGVALGVRGAALGAGTAGQSDNDWH